jgi:ATP-binding cassette subfamily B multidrug efflux pump
MSNKTVIVIAHRLSTIMQMDRIIVLKEGHILEDGTHKELLQKKGLYAGLWKLQAGGFIQDEN